MHEEGIRCVCWVEKVCVCLCTGGEREEKGSTRDRLRVREEEKGDGQIDAVDHWERRRFM